MQEGYSFGNTQTDEMGDRGWFIGHFMRPQDRLRHSEAVEIKWGVHPAGDSRPSWVVNSEATTVSILVKGLFQISFAESDLLLAKQGDYVVWGPGVAHHWIAIEDSVIVTVRWPSRGSDSTLVPDPRLEKHPPL